MPTLADGSRVAGANRDTGASQAPGGDRIVLLAAVLVLPTVALEQVLHVPTNALRTLAVYEAMHWLSDCLLALPLAAAAVWAGQRLAARFGLGRSLSDLAARACLICLVFALLLVPGEAMHEQVDRLTHAAGTLSIHNHVALPPTPVSPAVFVLGYVGHGVVDGFAGQLAGGPFLLLALIWAARGWPGLRPGWRQPTSP